VQLSVFLCKPSIFLAPARETRLRSRRKSWVSAARRKEGVGEDDAQGVDAALAEAGAEGPERRDLLGRDTAGDLRARGRGVSSRGRLDERIENTSATHLALVANEDDGERVLLHAVGLEVPVALAHGGPDLAAALAEEEAAEGARRARELEEVVEVELARDLRSEKGRRFSTRARTSESRERERTRTSKRRSKGRPRKRVELRSSLASLSAFLPATRSSISM